MRRCADCGEAFEPTREKQIRCKYCAVVDDLG